MREGGWRPRWAAATLEQAGYVSVRKTGAGRNRRTHLRLSATGRHAFRAHAAALQQNIAAAGAADVAAR